jgi:LysM repeat protein
MIDIQVNYNSGKFSESAQPGMDLVDEMFSVQESMLRTGADPRTNGMVKTLQANEEKLIDLELAAKPFRREIELLNREIRGMEQDIEKTYTRPIEGLQEEISDLERTLEIDPKFGDRAMEAINNQNAKMSNDAAIMANQAETINDKYDKQAEALAKVAEINEDILNQQKSQLDIAGALTSGDISAAAKAVQEARAQSAQRFSGSLSQALDQSRANEIDGLRGAETGFSQKEIDQKQFENAQALYKMENDPARLKIVSDIRDKQDQIYKLEELRENKLADIQIKQDAILKKQVEQLQPLEDQIEDITYSNELIQAQIDKYVKGIDVLGKTQLEWDAVKSKIDANTLAGKNFDGQLGALLASTDAIDKKWQSILDKLAAYNGIPQGVTDAKTQVEQSSVTSEQEVLADKALAESIVAEQAALDAAKTANAVVPTTTKPVVVAPVKTAVTVKSGQTLSSIAKANGTTVAALQAANPKLMTDPKYNDGRTIFSGTKITIPAPKATSVGSGGGSGSMLFKSKGGLIPKYFARGGFARGTDTVPAMLTPGEFIVSKYGVNSYGADNLKKINNGDAPGGAVYNNTYTLTVNAKTNANPNEIAQAVMSTIKQVDDRRIRGVSLNGR